MPKFKPIALSSGGELPSTLPGPEEGLRLFVNNPRVVELPEEGKVTFCFERGPLTIREGEEGASASVELILTQICGVEECEVEEELSEPKQAENALDAIFEQLRGETESGEEEVED